MGVAHQMVKDLKAQGHTIIIHTARGMKPSKVGEQAALGVAIAEVGCATFKNLAEHEIPFDEIVFGKPHADVYLDDKAVNALSGDMDRGIGWMLADGASGQEVVPKNLPAREFNKVLIMAEHVEKKGLREYLLGEIHFYKNCPESIKDLFPKMHDSDTSEALTPFCSVTIERIFGITFTHMSINRCVTPQRLILVMDALSRIHRCELPPNQKSDGLLDYGNYYNKVKARLTQHSDVYTSLLASEADHREVQRLLTYLKAYESQQRAFHCGRDPWRPSVQ
ncbi:hypothetical protein CYMTET_53832 [Cymbomonas tetramitiformis]|uniref:Uncharacterized protein n=1 Tax=Cymbomonas tetramitiformis TaxID=36881 RepID=A0AAE0ERC5_9CHLO|nr:hypothetical protein CYMTET_53832 [Cymbomonas tetramitiformis]